MSVWPKPSDAELRAFCVRRIIEKRDRYLPLDFGRLSQLAVSSPERALPTNDEVQSLIAECYQSRADKRSIGRVLEAVVQIERES